MVNTGTSTAREEQAHTSARQPWQGTGLTSRGADGAMHEAVAAIAACGVSPVVRVAANEAWMVKSTIMSAHHHATILIVFAGALDAGAHGVLVPLLYTADDARRLVSSAKFPPLGTRGFGSPFPMEKFSQQTTAEYLLEANDALVTIVQIETKEALQNVRNSFSISSRTRHIQAALPTPDNTIALLTQHRTGRRDRQSPRR